MNTQFARFFWPEEGGGWKKKKWKKVVFGKKSTKKVLDKTI